MRSPARGAPAAVLALARRRPTPRCRDHPAKRDRSAGLDTLHTHRVRKNTWFVAAGFLRSLILTCIFRRCSALFRLFYPVPTVPIVRAQALGVSNRSRRRAMKSAARARLALAVFMHAKVSHEVLRA